MRRQKEKPVSNETVRYRLNFCGTWTQEWQHWQGPVALARVNYGPVLSSVRPRIRFRLVSDSNQNLVMGLRWLPHTEPDWPIDRRSQYIFSISLQSVSVYFTKLLSDFWFVLY
jgi:hypothetical protein